MASSSRSHILCSSKAFAAGRQQFIPFYLASLFALHVELDGWNFHFPTHVEQLLWRIEFFAITFIPSVPLFLALRLSMVLAGAGLIVYMFAQRTGCTVEKAA